MEKKTKFLIMVILLALPALACSTFFRAPRIFQEDVGVPIDTNLEGVENGERIYFTAIDSHGDLLRYRGGPDFGGMMMGSYLTCASCHGPEGQGGRHFMHMQVMDAPNISYQALAGEAEEHGDEHGEYSLEDFRRAVVEGEHPDGDPLSREMPRWRISDQDLEDLFAFIKTLP